MEDLNLILSLIQGHPVIALLVAAYFLFFRGGSTTTTKASGGFTIGTFLVPLLKYLLSKFEPVPGPGPAPAPFDLAEFLKKLVDELLKAKSAGDKDHEEAVLKVLAKCEHCDQTA